MNKIKLFIENFLIYGFGGIISKIIPLIMVPIITRIMPNSEYYGLSDLATTITTFACYIAVMGMYDAMYRMFFENEDEKYRKCVCSTALLFTLCTSIVVFFIMILLKNIIAQFFLGNRQYAYLVYILAVATLVGATNNIISAPTRMQNQRKIYLITNTISPVLSYAISIPMLLKGYYTIALPLATLISNITMEISFYFLNRNWFRVKMFDVELLKQMLVIGLPLLPGFLIYWIFNSCDRVMITNMMGIGAAGIYSVGAKLGNCSQLIYIAFSGGWQYFAFSVMKEKDQIESNSKIFEYLGIISFIVTAFVCAWSFSIYKFLFTEQYLSGYIIAPYLFLAPLLQMLFQIASNQFLVIRKTWPNMFILSSGALVNIIINYYLIPVLGIEGAAIATLFGYIISDTVCVLALIKMKLMILEKTFIYAVILMILYMLFWRCIFFSSIVLGTISASTFTIILLLLYKDTVLKFWNILKRYKRIRG